ncbi:leucine-rich repeat domain-containing protein [Roseivirga misakiensis]|nr:leucine-rich repeat domain-containing protein [Roseivirga misakiensis]
MNNLAEKSPKNILRILISNLLFTSIFLFQVDFDDSRSYSVIGNFLGFQSEFLERYGYNVVGIALLLYLTNAVFMVRIVRKDRIKGANYALLILSILFALVLPNVYALTSFRINERQEISRLEDKGIFNALEDVLRSAKQTDRLTINPYYKPLTEFPSELLKLDHLKSLNLKGHEITAIPNDISLLMNLESLNLLDNKLEAINPSICDCQNLVELRVGGKIQTIPECLKKMKTLKHLSFQSSHANELIEELREFKNLETAHFYLYRDWNAYNAMTEEEKDEFSKNSTPFDRVKWNQLIEETGIEHKY